jgi:hypothetical protein
MKETITIELGRDDINAAIRNYLEPKGYKVSNINFQFSRSVFEFTTKVSGAEIEVTKIQNEIKGEMK